MDGVADYRFVSSLGEMGHGQFYLAHTPQRLGLETPLVGVKVFEQATDEDTLRRATRELRAFAAVSSPYLVKLLDAGRDGSWFYYATEHCPGGSLAAPTRPLGRPEQLAAIGRAARGAHALHEAGMVHRGIHPGSILLTDDGARLADLGLADVLDPTTSVTGLGPAGAVEFIDPAVLAGETASPASDIWSLGVTLHKVLTGTGLYGDLPTHDALLAVRRVLTAPPQVSSELAPREAELVSSCVAPDPGNRPGSALAVAEEIERLVA
ncbi:serine/threonine-protein kinase [Nocardioides coralli]|uniref:serine/threonine-protein kinase n=1 Tax=Nocardioides coralli TaxID=2872154 RepID=UPI001CA41A82|nr:serine/threonine-protein kinase [Nocardioides coralli]QZY30463.1 serine/threonine protein kinase [Nocardioides coralli]